MKALETIARNVAADLGRDWSDCGTYERESFFDEARRIIETREKSIGNCVREDRPVKRYRLDTAIGQHFQQMHEVAECGPGKRR